METLLTGRTRNAIRTSTVAVGRQKNVVNKKGFVRVPLVYLADPDYKHRKDYFDRMVSVPGVVSVLRVAKDVQGDVKYEGILSMPDIEEGRRRHLRFYSDEFSSLEILPELRRSCEAYKHNRQLNLGDNELAPEPIDRGYVVLQGIFHKYARKGKVKKGRIIGRLLVDGQMNTQAEYS